MIESGLFEQSSSFQRSSWTVFQIGRGTEFVELYYQLQSWGYFLTFYFPLCWCYAFTISFSLLIVMREYTEMLKPVQSYLLTTNRPRWSMKTLKRIHSVDISYQEIEFLSNFSRSIRDFSAKLYYSVSIWNIIDIKVSNRLDCTNFQNSRS